MGKGPKQGSVKTLLVLLGAVPAPGSRSASDDDVIAEFRRLARQLGREEEATFRKDGGGRRDDSTRQKR